MFVAQRLIDGCFLRLGPINLLMNYFAHLTLAVSLGPLKYMLHSINMTCLFFLPKERKLRVHLLYMFVAIVQTNKMSLFSCKTHLQ